MSIATVVKHALTEKDNQTFSLARIGWALSLLTYLALSIYDVVHNKTHFDLQGFGTGLGLVLAAGGAAVGMQAKTEAAA